MAFLDMYNSDKHKGQYFAPMSPRISFSNDFIDPQQLFNSNNRDRISREAPVSSDFEFSVSNFSMNTADELFFNGRLLPLEDTSSTHMQKITTLRDELLVDDQDATVPPRPPKGSAKWNGFLGLKKSHISSKKAEKIDAKKSAFVVHEEKPLGKPSQLQELLSGGGSSCCEAKSGV